MTIMLVRNDVNMEEKITHLLTPRSFSLPCHRILLHVQNLRPHFPEDILVHSRSLLRVRRDDVLRNRVLDVTLDERVQIRRQNARKVIRYIRAKKELLDLAWKALNAARSKNGTPATKKNS